MKYKSLLILLVIGVGLLTMTSCLEDLEDHYGAFSTTPAVAELSENANAATGTLIKALPITGSPVELKVRVNIAAPNALDRDITITIDTVRANLTAFNAAKAAAAAATTPPTAFVPYELIPDSLWYFVSKTVTIPKGTRELDHIIMVNTHKFNPSKTYILPLEILDANGLVISGNYGKQFIQIGAKNKYDGVYTVTAVTPMLDIVSASLVGMYPFTYHLKTVGGNSVECHDAAYMPATNAVRHRIGSVQADGSIATSYYGSFGIIINFNPDGSGSIVSLVNPYGSPAANTRDIALDASGTNTWNPTTKEINIKYMMTMSSSVPTPPHYRVFFNEKWTYVGPRP